MTPVATGSPSVLVTELRRAFLERGEPSMSDLAARAGVNRANTWKHLKRNGSAREMLAVEKLLAALGKKIVIQDA